MSNHNTLRQIQTTERTSRSSRIEPQTGLIEVKSTPSAVLPPRPTLLYVDDNARSSRLLTGVLEDCGFRVIAKNDPVESLLLCRHTYFDLALLDYEMPAMNGARLAREIKALVPDVPVVLISSRAELPPDEAKFVDAHFGFATDLDDLLWTLRILSRSQTVHIRNPERTNSAGLDGGTAGELRWADST